MRLHLVKKTHKDIIEQSVALLNTQYGKTSLYSKWVLNGFRPFSYEYMLGQVTNPMRELYVMLDSNRVCAMIIVQYEKDNIVLFHKFCVDPAPVYKGIGAKLLLRAENIAMNKGAGVARVEVFSPAIKLVNYYIMHGYNRVIGFKKLEGIAFTCVNAEYGFLMLEKTLETKKRLP